MSSKTVKLVSFANIKTSWELLGRGSFSKVFKGSYKNTPCAIKVMYSIDLTAADVRKAMVEATILTAAKHPNIVSGQVSLCVLFMFTLVEYHLFAAVKVDIYGVCVNPPNLCMIIELCAMGALSDVLRDPTIRLSPTDELYLALGCCAGVNALHSLNDTTVHRDIKSMNFLVDGQLNVKLADLELGQDETSRSASGTSQEDVDYLLNWMPPEVSTKHIRTALA